MISLNHHFDPLEVCGSVCICRDPVLYLYFLILLVSGHSWPSTFGQWRAANNNAQGVRCVTIKT